MAEITHEPGEVDSHEYMGALQDFQNGEGPKVKYMAPDSMKAAEEAAEEEEAE